MDVPALKLGTGGPVDQLLRTRLAIASPYALAEMRREEAPAVLLVRNEDLADLGRLQEETVNRGRKHPSTDLSSLALGRHRIPVIEGSYSSSGQLLNSLRTLFRNAVSHKERNLYLVGSSDRLFRRLWSGAAGDVEASGEVQYTIATSGSQRSASVGATGVPVQEVPDELARMWPGESEAARGFQGLLLVAAETRANVLMVGPAGCRRGLAARAIHDLSALGSGPFVSLDCSASSEPRLRAELFGSRKEAGTALREGLWATARHGTLYLREIGCMSARAQEELVSAMKLDHGGGQPRILASSNRVLHPSESTLGFMEELYFLLRGLYLRVPPLRERPSDIPGLAEETVRRITGEPTVSIPRRLLDRLRKEPWPGNEAELERTLGDLLALFGHRGLTLRRWVAMRDCEQGESPDLDRHWLPNLRFLRGLEEILAALRVGLRAYLEDQTPDRSMVEATVKSLERRSIELESHCQAARRVGNPQLLARVLEFRLQLEDLAGKVGAGAGARPGRVGLAAGEPELDALKLTVSREIRRAL